MTEPSPETPLPDVAPAVIDLNPKLNNPSATSDSKKKRSMLVRLKGMGIWTASVLSIFGIVGGLYSGGKEVIGWFTNGPDTKLEVTNRPLKLEYNNKTHNLTLTTDIDLFNYGNQDDIIKEASGSIDLLTPLSGVIPIALNQMDFEFVTDAGTKHGIPLIQHGKDTVLHLVISTSLTPSLQSTLLKPGYHVLNVSMSGKKSYISKSYRFHICKEDTAELTKNGSITINEMTTKL